MRAPGISEAQRNVESLFESHTVVEIREVETKTAVDIEEKKKQLRQLVGGSYRDLISSADTILDMTCCCDGMLHNIKHIQGGFSDLRHSVSSADTAKDAMPASTRQRQMLAALGSRVKYLVDTPELIWGCLDTREFLAAAQRLARAAAVRECLMAGDRRSSIERRFPLIGHLWPNMEKFRSQILEQSRQWLSSEASVHCDAAATALAAMACLEDLGSQKVLETFLDARRQWLLHALHFSPATGLDSADAASARLAVIAAQIQEAICTAGELFLGAHKGLQRAAVLPARAQEEGMSVGELLFDRLPGTDGDTDEASAWQANSKAVMERLQPLSSAETQAACSRWLSHVASTAQGAILQLLRGCRDAAELASAEGKLRGALQGWRHAPQAERTAPKDILSPRAAAVRSADGAPGPSPFAAATVLPDAAPVLPVDWEGVCQWVMGGRIVLWDEVFEKAFLQRGEELIAASFSEVVARLKAPLDACMEAAGQSDAAGPGKFQAMAWPEEDTLAPATPQKVDAGRRRAGRPTQLAPGRGKGRAADSADEAARPPSWRAQLQELERTVNVELKTALSNAMLLLADQAQHVRPSSSGLSSWDSRGNAASASLSLRTGGARRQTRRSAALEPHIQQRCCDAASAIADDLQRRLSGLPSAKPGEADAQIIEQALLLGRLAAAFGGAGSAFAAIAGPQELWREFLRGREGLPGSTASASGARGKLQASYSLLEPAQARFRRVGLAGHEQWATWAAKALGAQLRSSMQADPALAASAPLRGWADTVITHEDELGGSAEEMRFALPAVPSPGAQEFLLAGAQEVARADGCHLSGDALALLVWRLGDAALSTFREALQLGSPLDRAVTEKGVLQLLFDVRFLGHALAGGRPPAPDQAVPGGAPGIPPAAGGAAQAQRKKAFAELERSLQERLDPIDWATYEPYVWANEAALRPRTAVLYGLLTRLGQQGMDLVARGAPPGEANVMAVAKQAARFKYLPISTPSIASEGLRRGGGAPQAFGGGEKSLEDYTFSGSRQTGEASLAEQAAQSAAASTFEALQSRFTSQSQRLGVFGTLLGDKAAEVTAMAQQSFSDIALPSAFASALASDKGSASGLLSSFKGSFQGASSGQ